MSDPRPNLDTIRTQHQVPDDEIILYRPRAYGAIDVPFTEGYAVSITKTEGALLDRLTRDRGLLGLRGFQDEMRDAFSQAEARYPDTPLPGGIPAELERAWQGNYGHRDDFRHTYWSARMTQEYGADWARAFTTAHEGRPGNEANREAMDLYNNAIGIEIGAANPNASPEELADLVQKAVTDGKSVVMQSDGQLQWSDRVPVGQHGLSPSDVIGPHKATPGVVSTRSVAALDPSNGLHSQDGTALAAADARGEAGIDARLALSPQAQTLLNDSERQVRQMAERHGLTWDQGLDNTVAAVAHQARADGLTGINRFNVLDGQIRFAQYDGYTLQEGRVDAHLAANTPAAASRENMAQTDLAMSRQQEPQAIEQAPAAMHLRA
jgi:hypothetical protein